MDEKRVEARPRMLKTGIIHFNGGHTVIDCSVRNMTTGGAKLRLTGTLPLPPTFNFRLAGEKTDRPCRLAWAREDEIGIEFT